MTTTPNGPAISPEAGAAPKPYVMSTEEQQAMNRALLKSVTLLPEPAAPPPSAWHDRAESLIEDVIWASDTDDDGLLKERRAALSAHLRTVPGAESDACAALGVPAAPTAGDADDLARMERRNKWHSFDDIVPTLKAARAGSWQWFLNMDCKYIEVRIDMRDLGCILMNRNRERISPAMLARQGGAPARGIVSPEGGETGTGSTAQPQEPGEREAGTRPDQPAVISPEQAESARDAARLIDAIAAEWDGCMYDAPGGAIDIGEAIRRTAMKATP